MCTLNEVKGMKFKMKKVKVIGIILSMMMILTGCGGSKDLKTAYNKMEKELKGYRVDYRLYGTYKNKSVNDIVRIQKSNEKVIVDDLLDIDTDLSIQKEETKIDKKLYEKPEIYLEGIKNTKEKNKKEEKIGENTYKVYDK